MNTQQQVASPRVTLQISSLGWILGVGLPLVAGTMFWWIPALRGYADVMDDFTTGAIVLGVTMALSFVAATALRSGWALLIVPAAWVVGETVTALIMSLGASNVDWEGFLPLLVGVIFYALPPLLIAAGLGMFFGQWLTRRGAAHGANQAPLGK